MPLCRMVFYHVMEYACPRCAEQLNHVLNARNLSMPPTLAWLLLGWTHISLVASRRSTLAWLLLAVLLVGGTHYQFQR
eukprot:80904-Pelagomonas_calceolata.AAC.2